MIGYGVNQAKSLFFDRHAVMKKVADADRKALTKAGAKIRSRAQRSIKIRPGSSAVGQPPHGHVSGTRQRRSKSKGTTRTRKVSLLREFIFFVYQPPRSVIIGPAKLNSRVGDAPHALEYGGSSAILSHGKKLTVSIGARPFMRPALAEEIKTGNVPKHWANSVST